MATVPPTLVVRVGRRLTVLTGRVYRRAAMRGRQERLEAKASRQDRDENPVQRWEYFARNLTKVPGMGLEDDFNKHGQKGWEFVAMATGGSEGYAIFKRPVE